MQKGKILDYWKSYARDNRLICARVYKMSARFGTSMSAQLILMDAGTMKGATVRRLKSYVSWVKYVVRQYGFYLLEEIRI